MELLLHIMSIVCELCQYALLPVYALTWAPET